MVKDININDFDYNLPEDRIPLHPLEKRDECKLLVFSPKRHIYHRVFKELPDLLPPGAFVVCNDTKVINARLLFHKETGAAIELFLLEPLSPADYQVNFQSRDFCTWKCLVGNSKKWKEGLISATIPIGSGKELKVYARRGEINEDGSSAVTFIWEHPEITFSEIIEQLGKMPIPPYLNRESEDSDLQDYQTVYARVTGSVAAPTAGLHFTPQVFDDLRAHNVGVGKVTLHVGAGTFRPVKSETIGDHSMHSEPFSVTLELIDRLIEWKKSDKPIVAVGTTSVRTLESLPYIGYAFMKGDPNPLFVDQWRAYEEEDFDTVAALEKLREYVQKSGMKSVSASTSIMIAPGFKWRVVDIMVTNFHQPKSTLLLLVSSFLGGEVWKYLYEEALERDYRFLSYGDACLFFRPSERV